MNKPIKTIADLEHEELRLKGQLASYKLLIKDDIQAVKDSLNPVKKVMDTVKQLFTREKGAPLVNFGLNFGVDMLFKRLLLARANWLVKVVVPYLIKNYASHIIGEEDKAKIVKTLKNLLSKINFKKAARKTEEAVA